MTRNTGAVIPPDQGQQLFQPVQQLGGNRIHHGGGHGLGRAIVEAIANAHQATPIAHAPPEGGLDIQISLP